MTETEAEEDRLFWETYDELTKYLSTKTNCSVIRCATAEADDIIARWIALHPQDEHTIVSSDTDFVQLLAANVTQYNGISDELLTLEGIFDAKGNRVNDKKTKQPKTIPDPAWLLFEKCVATPQTTYSVRILEYVRKAQRIKLVSVRPLETETSADTIGTT
jgi:hypothetical protein